MNEATDKPDEAAFGAPESSLNGAPSDSVPVESVQGGKSSEAAPEPTAESTIEALLFSTDVPLSGRRIAYLLGVGDAGDVKRHIERLNERYDGMRSAFRIESIAKGHQMLTLPVFDTWIKKLHKARAETRLSSAALETLAIVAYKQPVLRVDIESVRGVAVGDMLVRMRDMNLIRIVGRAEEIGWPLLYGTTSRFLEAFGLESLRDLPKLDPESSDDVPRLTVVDSAKTD